MKEVQILNIEEAQIVSKLDSDVKLIKDMTIGPFETGETKGILRKTPNYYKRINVVIDDLRENWYCRDIAVVYQLQILKPRWDRIPVVLQNLYGRTLKLKRGTRVAHVEASQVVPPLDGSLERGGYIWKGYKRHHKRKSIWRFTWKGWWKSVKDFRKIRPWRYRVMDWTTTMFSQEVFGRASTLICSKFKGTM